jgi:hypothetical protein
MLNSSFAAIPGAYCTRSCAAAGNFIYSNPMTAEMCLQECTSQGYTYAGINRFEKNLKKYFLNEFHKLSFLKIKSGYYCHCGNTIKFPATQQPSTCNRLCNGNSSLYCGSRSYGAFSSVYSYGGKLLLNI